jgi:hypothetical protein
MVLGSLNCHIVGVVIGQINTLLILEGIPRLIMHLLYQLGV